MPKKGLRVCNIVNAQEAQSGHKFTKTPRFFFVAQWHKNLPKP